MSGCALCRSEAHEGRAARPDRCMTRSMCAAQASAIEARRSAAAVHSRYHSSAPPFPTASTVATTSPKSAPSAATRTSARWAKSSHRSSSLIRFRIAGSPSCRIPRDGMGPCPRIPPGSGCGRRGSGIPSRGAAAMFGALVGAGARRNAQSSQQAAVGASIRRPTRTNRRVSGLSGWEVWLRLTRVCVAGKSIHDHRPGLRRVCQVHLGVALAERVMTE